MTLATAYRNKIDALWLDFHSGGITNPITVIEQISYLMFARLLDITESRNEKRAGRLKKDFKRLFPEDKQHIRWSHFRNEGGDRMLAIVRDEFFPFMRTNLQQHPLGRYLKDANCLIPSGNLLSRAVAAIEELPLTEGDAKGDIYEHFLGKLSTAALVETDAEGNKHYPGDLLEPYLAHIRGGMFHGFDFDITMLRTAAMNLLLHNVEAPSIHYQDTLGSNFSGKFPREAANYFDVILANPPFKGMIDLENVDPMLKSKVKTKKTELLFLVLILHMLKMGGRAAVIVPDGVLLGSSQAHLGVRQLIVDDNQLEAVISCPPVSSNPTPGSPPPSSSLPKAAAPIMSGSTTSKPTASRSTTNVPPSPPRTTSRIWSDSGDVGTGNSERGTAKKRGIRNAERGMRKPKNQRIPPLQLRVPRSPLRVRIFQVPRSHIRVLVKASTFRFPRSALKITTSRSTATRSPSTRNPPTSHPKPSSSV